MKKIIVLNILIYLTAVTFGQSKWDKFFKKVEKASKEAQKIDKQVQQLKKQADKSGRKQSTSVPHFKDISKAAVPLDTAIPYFLSLNLENLYSNS